MGTSKILREALNYYTKEAYEHNNLSIELFDKVVTLAKNAIDMNERTEEQNQWLYGKLNIISDVIEKGRIESGKFK